tara:strand:- start:1287 stop:1478 length:192 start_codon:yes stop_codon:yes gene_type:complete
MTDAPEKIWAHAPTTFDEMDARIKELERALRRIKGWAVGASGQTAAETYMRAIACAALKAGTK